MKNIGILLVILALGGLIIAFCVNQPSFTEKIILESQASSKTLMDEDRKLTATINSMAELGRFDTRVYPNRNIRSDYEATTRNLEQYVGERRQSFIIWLSISGVLFICGCIFLSQSKKSSN